MALSESIEYDKIEVVGSVQICTGQKSLPSSRKMVQNLQDLLRDLY